MRYIWVISIRKSALTGWKSAYDSYEMHAQHHKGIPQTIPKDDTNSQDIHSEKKISKDEKNTQSFLFLPTATAKKPTLTSFHSGPPQFTC